MDVLHRRLSYHDGFLEVAWVCRERMVAVIGARIVVLGIIYLSSSFVRTPVSGLENWFSKVIYLGDNKNCCDSLVETICGNGLV